MLRRPHASLYVDDARARGRGSGDAGCCGQSGQVTVDPGSGQGKYADAARIQRCEPDSEVTVHEVLKRVLGAEHPHTLVQSASANNLALSLSVQGKYADSDAERIQSEVPVHGVLT
jgi:hypothetical protein